MRPARQTELPSQFRHCINGYYGEPTFDRTGRRLLYLGFDTLAEGAVLPFTTPAGRRMQRRLLRACKESGVPSDIPVEALDAAQRDWIFRGDGRSWRGVEAYFARLERKHYKVQARVLIARYRSFERCAACDGSRLRPEALCVRVGGRDIAQVCALTLAQLGADVIRFDPIGGGLDYTRWPITDDGRSLFWAGFNKAKRSLAVDLRSPRDARSSSALLRFRLATDSANRKQMPSEACTVSSNRVLGGDGRRMNTGQRTSFREVSYRGRKESIERLGVFHHKEVAHPRHDHHVHPISIDSRGIGRIKR